MKVYVSTSSACLDTARQIMASVEAAGHENALDWTTSFGSPENTWGVLAEGDIESVQSSAVMLLIGMPTTGCLVEVGVALATGVPVVWHCSPDEYRYRHFFLHHPLVYGVHGGLSNAIGLLAWVSKVIGY